MAEPVNDLDLSKEGWKEACASLWTDSLWLIPNRDRSGVHQAGYHGNFVPQIPHQFLRRFTKPGGWVLDPFLGSGTTLIEAQRLGRNGIGIELQPEVARAAWAALDRERPGPEGPMSAVEVGDALTYNYTVRLPTLGCPGLDLVILHPPYHDIIRFSDCPADLSTMPLPQFLAAMGRLTARIDPHLKRGGHLVLVIGDKYTNSELVPLGWLTAQQMPAGYTLKGIVVKDMQNSRAKQGQDGIWRYRALKGGYFVFRHEYIFLYRKP